MDDIPRERLTGPLRRDAVKKHVAAIHVSGKLTLLQRKLSNVLLLNAYDTLTSQTRHRIDARTLCLMIGYNSNDMETLKHLKHDVGYLRSIRFGPDHLVRFFKIMGWDPKTLTDAQEGA